MSFIVVSSSLNAQSKSAILAREAHRLLSAKAKTEWLDLRELDLPHCDGDKAYAHPNVRLVTKKLDEASCIILAVPIYNFDCGSSAKNLVELTGTAWEEKTVGFLCAAGGKSSYMSIMGLANSLMLDFRSLIIPRFVYADGSAFEGDKLKDKDITERIQQFVDAAIKLDAANNQT